MSKWRRIVGAILLTVLLTAVVVADAVQLLSDSASYAEAGLKPNIKLMTAQYDQNGNFTGCGGSPSNCAVIVLFRTEITISPEGLHM